MTFDERMKALTDRQKTLDKIVDMNGRRITDLIVAISKDAEDIRALEGTAKKRRA